MAKNEDETLRNRAKNKAKQVAETVVDKTKTGTRRTAEEAAELRRKIAANRQRRREAKSAKTGRPTPRTPGREVIPTADAGTRTGPDLRSTRARSHSLTVPGEPQTPPPGETPKAKKSLAKRIFSPKNIVSAAAEAAYQYGDYQLDEDQAAARQSEGDLRLGPLAKSGGQTFQDDGMSTPFRSFAMGLNERYNQTDVSEMLKSYMFDPVTKWQAPSNYVEMNPGGKATDEENRRIQQDEQIMDAASAGGAGYRGVQEAQGIRDRLPHAEELLAQTPDQNRAVFATAAEGVNNPEAATRTLRQLNVNPDLQQQVGLQDEVNVAPLVSYDGGVPENAFYDDLGPVFNEGQGGTGASTGRLRSRVGPDGQVLFTDLPQAGTVEGSVLRDQAGAEAYAARIPQFGQQAIDYTEGHLRNRGQAVDQLSALEADRPGGGLRILGGGEGMRQRHSQYVNQERQALRDNIDSVMRGGQPNQDKAFRDKERELGINQPDPAAGLPSFEEIAQIEDPTLRRAAMLDRDVQARSLAARELAATTSETAIRQAIDPTGQLGRSNLKRDRDELKQRREAYLEQQESIISGRYGIRDNVDVDSLDNQGMTGAEWAKAQRDQQTFNDNRLDRAAERTDNLIERLQPEGNEGLKQDAIDIGLYDDPNLSDNDRRDALTSLAIMRKMSEIYPSMEPEFAELLNNTPPQDVATRFREMFNEDGGTLSRSTPGFWSGAGNVLGLFDMQQGWDEMGAAINNILQPGQPHQLLGKNKPGILGGDYISEEEFLEESGLTKEDLRRVIPR